MSIDVNVPEPAESLTHVGLIYYLLKLGRMLEFDTYTAHRSESFCKTRLGALASIEDIAPYIQPDRLDTVRFIDVIWLRDNVIEYCFEVEFASSMRKAALRLCEVPVALKLIIVGPKHNHSKYSRLKHLSPFRRIWKKFHFVECEKLIEYYSILKEEKKQRKDVLG
jgi:hypothetical protein